MPKTVKKSENGKVIYSGFLTAQERHAADLVLHNLEEQLPKVEEQLLKKYGASVLYKYYLGKFLNDFMAENGISSRERGYLWQEIRSFTPSEIDSKDRSEKRSLYEQCWTLAQQDLETVTKLSWHQWQDFLDREKNMDEPRIFEWIKYHDGKIKGVDWRPFHVALHGYLKKHDLTFFTDSQVFMIYDNLLQIASTWRVQFKKFVKGQTSESAKKNKESKESYHRKRYYTLLFTEPLYERVLTEDELVDTFTQLMKQHKRGKDSD